jgi:hypothetical protein
MKPLLSRHFLTLRETIEGTQLPQKGPQHRPQIAPDFRVVCQMVKSTAEFAGDRLRHRLLDG